MALWVVFNCDWVALRYCSATIAPVLVLTLKDMVVSVLVWVERFARRRFARLGELANAVPETIQEFLTIDWRADPERAAR